MRVTFHKRAIENCYYKAKYTPPKGGMPGMVTVSGLEPGYYTLSFKECNINTFLTVHDGTYWKDESFILKKNTLMEFKTNKNIAYAKIRKLRNHPATKKDEITIKVFNSNGNTRAHIMTTHFISSNDLLYYN